MKVHVFRLTKGMLLKESIMDYCIKNNIKSGVISSSVGCLSKAFIRNAGAKQIIEINSDLEIIAMNGTVSNKRIHIHISVADDDLKLFGGHLEDGCVVNTTAEMVITEFKGYMFDKEFDENTGYNELKVINIPKKES